MKKLTLILLASIGLSLFGSAQGLLDPTLTMYSFQPLTINPALTGNMDSKWRVNAVYREQGYIVSRPFRVFSGSFDMQLPINAWAGNIWGFGLNVVNDDQGDSYLVNRRINANFSIGQYLDARNQHSISVGFAGGLGMRGIDYGDTYWDRQWVGDGFNVRDVISGEPEDNQVNNYAEVSTGIQYTYYSGDLVEFTGGVGVFHLNRPDVSLYNDTAGTNMQRRTAVHGEFTHKIRDNSMFAIKPKALYSRQASRASLQAGTNFQFLFNEGTRTTGKRNESSIMLGLFGRFANSTKQNPTNPNPEKEFNFDILATASMEFAGFTFGGGYDVPLGSFQTVNGYEGGFEFMIGYRAGYQRGLYSKYSPNRKGKL
jgi:type IX secretion system PorP/SprF family membrane protein